MKSKSHFDDATRHNWGVEDGRNARKHGWFDARRRVECSGQIRHFDRAYAKGFLTGWNGDRS